MAVGDKAMAISEHLYNSEQSLRWRLWEENNRREDAKAEKRMKLVFASVGAVILLMLILSIVR